MSDATIVYTVPQMLVWDWRVTADLFLGGTGVGAFFVALYADHRFRDRHPEVTRLAAWAAPLCIIGGVILLMAKLGHPERIWMTVEGFSATAPLSWGSFFQALLIGLALVYAIALRGGEDTRRTRQWLAVASVPVALFVGGYHGFLLSAMRAHALWNTGAATVAAVLAFVITGLALVTLLLCMHPRRRDLLDGIREIRWLLGAALLAQIGTLFVWWVSLEWGLAPARDALATANASWGTTFWIGAIGVGLVLPLLLGGAGILAERRLSQRARVALIAVSSLLILVGGYMFRHSVLMGGQLA